MSIINKEKSEMTKVYHVVLSGRWCERDVILSTWKSAQEAADYLILRALEHDLKLGVDHKTGFLAAVSETGMFGTNIVEGVVAE